MHTFVKYFIGFVFVLMICYFVVVGFLVYKGIGAASEADWSNGLKGIVDKVWCGEKGCKN